MNKAEEYKYDVFFSFTSVNNDPLPQSDDGEGWINRFGKELVELIEDRIGRKLRIAQSSAEEVAVHPAATRAVDVKQARFFVPILSLRYLDSKRHLEELAEMGDISKRRSERSIIAVAIHENVKSRLPPDMSDLTFIQFVPDGFVMKAEPGSDHFDRQIGLLVEKLCVALGKKTIDPVRSDKGPGEHLEDLFSGEDFPRFLYRLVLENPDCHEVLVEASEAHARAAFERLRGDDENGTELAAAIREGKVRLEEKHKKIEPDPLWLAWMKEVHMAKLRPVIEQLAAEWGRRS